VEPRAETNSVWPQACRCRLCRRPTINGHAIEVRINAEKLPKILRPAPARFRNTTPRRAGVRMIAALYDGYKIPPITGQAWIGKRSAWP